MSGLTHLAQNLNPSRIFSLKPKYLTKAQSDIYIYLSLSLSLSLSPKPNQISPYVRVYIHNRSPPFFFFFLFKREQNFETKNVQNTILDLVSAFPSEWNISIPTNFIVLFWCYYKKLCIILYHIKLLFDMI